MPARSNSGPGSIPARPERSNHLAINVPPHSVSGHTSRSPARSPVLTPQLTSPPETYEDLQIQDTEEGAKRWFKLVVIHGSCTDGDEHVSKPTNDALEWFCRFLEGRFAVIKDSHFTPCTTDTPIIDKALDLCTVYNMMAVLASSIALRAGGLRRSHFTLASLVDALCSLKIFKDKDCKGGEGDGEQEVMLGDRMKQLVFMAVGWLTMLYEPDLHPEVGKLQISGNSTGRRGRRPGSAIKMVKQGLGHAQAPFRTLLLAFGQIIPHVDQAERNDLTASAEPEYLDLAYLSYYTLSQVCQLQIEWVDTLSLHLDLVESRKTLRLFRFPSFCRMVWTTEGDDCFLGSLFDSTNKHKYDSGDWIAHNEDVREYFRELLLSIRLLFGQDKRSWHTAEKEWNTIRPADPSKEDPLLERLCCASWDRELELYRQLEGHEPLDHFPAADFPNFRSKLIRLQQFSKQQHPQTWKLLWADRRDTRLYYTFWAVLVIGFATILLEFLQVFLNTWQVRLSHEANWLATEQNRLQDLQYRLGAQQCNCTAA